MVARVRATLTPIVLLLLLVGHCAPVPAQEIGVAYGEVRAGYEEALERPTGLSGSLDVPLSERVAIRVFAAHYTESRTITRSPCSGIPPPSRDCTEEPFEGDSNLTTYGVGLAVELLSSEASLQPELYVLGTASDVEVSFTAQNSDAQLQPVTPDGLSPGVALGGSMRYEITHFLALSGRFGLQAPRFGACGADAWFPFCESRVLPQLAVGARFGLSGLRQ